MKHGFLSHDAKSLHKSSTSNAHNDLAMSLCLLAVIITLALGRIALDANWLKCLRVSLAFCTYLGVVLALLRRGRFINAAGQLSFWPFALAAALAELVSGWLRPGASVSMTLEMAITAALLVGGVHWLSLRSWRLLRDKIERGGRANIRHAA
jgi:hypothetical protein